MSGRPSKFNGDHKIMRIEYHRTLVADAGRLAAFEQALAKVIRKGETVVADIRPESPTYMRWAGFDLTEDNLCMLYIPKGVAHGFQTLEPASEVFYQMGAYFAPQAGRGFRWDDPGFAIDWPLPPSIMSERDRTYPFFGA